MDKDLQLEVSGIQFSLVIFQKVHREYDHYIAYLELTNPIQHKRKQSIRKHIYIAHDWSSIKV